MSNSASHDLATQVAQITDPLLRLANAKGTDMLLVASLTKVFKDAGPRQAEVLRRCAVPRWIDLGVLALLRGKPHGNEQVLELLREYSFVRQIAPGRYAFHDQVRAVLLEEWKLAHTTELRELHLKLYDYFSGLSHAAHSINTPQDPRNKLLALRALPMGEWGLWQREAIYHLLCADQQRGMEQLVPTFNELLSGHLLAEAEALLQSISGVELNVESTLLVRYMRARIDQAGLRLDAAGDGLRALLQTSVNDQLRAQVQRSLGEVYAETGQWVRATALYRQSLAFFQRNKQDKAAADVQLLLADAYLGLGIKTGGWHLSAATTSPFKQLAERAWHWLLAVPFAIIGYLTRRVALLLPRPEYCVHYQNWLLIRLYLVSYDWCIRAREAYKGLGDEEGVLRAEQQRARVLLLYGYERESSALINQLLAHPLAQSPYRRALLQRTLAEGRMEHGDVAGAQALLAEALREFRAVGDIRREAAVLALQGRAAVRLGDAESALANYSTSLDRFRALRFTTAREQILYDLRVWNRSLSPDDPLRRRISALIAAEPEKRYIGRFPRSLLPVLQLASLLALPVALLLMVFVAPSEPVQRVVTGSQQLAPVLNYYVVSYSLTWSFVVLLLLLVLYLFCYAALGIMVIRVLPISQIDDEQPDDIVTTPDGIARYNSKGELDQQIQWRDVGRWLGLDRYIWSRPLPLYSRTFLEDAVGNDLRIDGITGWYSSLQVDIARHLESAGNPLPRSDLGYALLRSKSGASCVLGVLLMLLYIGTENGYEWLQILRSMPPLLYTTFGFVAVSGVLLLSPAAYWLAWRPLKLRRELELNNGWPWIVAGMGLFLPALVYLVNAGSSTITSVLDFRLLTWSSMLWGSYMVAEASVALLLPRKAGLRLLLVVSTMLLAIVISWQVPTGVFFSSWASAAVRRAAVLNRDRPGSPAAIEAANQAFDAGVAATSLEPSAQNLTNLGSAGFYAENYGQAINVHSDVIKKALPGSPEQAQGYYNRGVAYHKQGDLDKARNDYIRALEICSNPAFSNNQTCVNIRQRFIQQ